MFFTTICFGMGAFRLVQPITMFPEMDAFRLEARDVLFLLVPCTL